MCNISLKVPLWSGVLFSEIFHVEVWKILELLKEEIREGFYKGDKISHKRVVLKQR